ncbi:hypothetical protein LMG19083_04478 [Ralstonia psammae]|uniref:Uncharacterized protein n=1 Tax=Ralstonia psammae TaxID=3058598 RepID=A0ABM9JWQ3_9RALS|nr:hypothetical protein LMG19083_04478 [Ralstonia sp. LMG 19083]
MSPSVSMRSHSASNSADEASIPGRLMSVVCPSAWSLILMLVRLVPGTRQKPSSTPLRANSASNSSALASPRRPVAITGTCQSARQAATLTPLPPACWVTLRPILTRPRSRRSRPMVMSMAGLSVTVTMRGCLLMRPSPCHPLASATWFPGRAPPVRMRRPAPVLRAATARGCALRAAAPSQAQYRADSSTVHARQAP